MDARHISSFTPALQEPELKLLSRKRIASSMPLQLGIDFGRFCLCSERAMYFLHRGFLSFFLLQFKNLYYFVPGCVCATVCVEIRKKHGESVSSLFPVDSENRIPSLSPEPSHELCSGFTAQPRLAENMLSPCLSCLCAETGNVSIHSARIASVFYFLLHMALGMDTVGNRWAVAWLPRRLIFNVAKLLFFNPRHSLLGEASKTFL